MHRIVCFSLLVAVQGTLTEGTNPSSESLSLLFWSAGLESSRGSVVGVCVCVCACVRLCVYKHECARVHVWVSSLGLVSPSGETEPDTADHPPKLLNLTFLLSPDILIFTHTSLSGVTGCWTERDRAKTKRGGRTERERERERCGERKGTARTVSVNLDNKHTD